MRRVLTTSQPAEEATSSLLQREEEATPRDAFGRTLEEAQEEDSSYRADYLSRMRTHVDRLKRLETRTGVTGAVIGGLLLIASITAGIQLDPVRYGGSMERAMATFYWLVGGSITASLLGIAGIGLWNWLQESIRAYNREIGIEVDVEALEALEAPEEAQVAADFRDCRECGASIPTQAPSCRACGAVPLPAKPTHKTKSAAFRKQNSLTRSLVRTFIEGVKGPLDALGLLVLFMLIVATILHRLR